jgi:RNA recognition motif-containing protein
VLVWLHISIISSPLIVYDNIDSFCSQHIADRPLSIVSVINLTLGTSEGDLRAAFCEFGRTQFCAVPLSAPTTAIIVFSTNAEAAASVDGMDGAIADGKKIRVQERTITTRGGLSLLLRML